MNVCVSIGRWTSNRASLWPSTLSLTQAWRPRLLALGFSLLMTLAVFALQPSSASALTWNVSCQVQVNNNTPYTMHVYDSYTHGSGIINNVWPGAYLAPNSSTNRSASVFTSQYFLGSVYPINNHCTIDLSWELQKPDGSWSQGLHTSVYDPNSGSNGSDVTPSGDFAARTNVTSTELNTSHFESIVVNVSMKPGATAKTAEPQTGKREVTAERAVQTHRPKRLPSPLRRRDLAGAGWQQGGHDDLGRVGKILTSAPASGACQGQSYEPTPQGEGLSVFHRRRGQEFAAAAHGVFSSSRHARISSNASTSARHIRCLARLFRSERFGTSTSTQRTSFTVAGRKIALNRIKVRTRKDGKTVRVDYIDVIGVQRDKAHSVLMFANLKRPPQLRGEIAATAAAIRRLP